MKKVLVIGALLAVLVVPALSPADDGSPGFATTTTTTSTTKPPKPAVSDNKPATELARALCIAEWWSLGRKAFVAKYGANEPLPACVKATLPKVRAILAACKSRSHGNRDAFKRCVVAALKKK